MCVLGDEPMPAMRAALTGKSGSDRPLSVRRLRTEGEAGECELVFLAGSERARLPALRERLRGAPVLTVADGDGLAREGAMISLALRDRRVVFDVNAGAAREAGLAISSKLLRLARTVHGGSP